MTDLEDLLRTELRAAADQGPAFVAPDLAAGTDQPDRGRRHRWPVALAAAAVLVAGGVGFVALRSPDRVGTADCAFVLEWAGQEWTSTGTDRTPVAGKVLGTGVLPGCDDMGQGPGPDEQVEVRAIEGVDPDEAVLALDRVLLPVGATGLPTALRDARDPVRCDLEGSLRLTGRWTGVTSRRQVRFDGDVRPPYRIDFVTTDPRVTDGWASVLLRARGTVRTRPLRPADVKAMLWDEGTEVLTSHCEDGRFVVDSLDPAG